MKIKLRKMRENQKGKIVQINAASDIARRIRDLGVIPGMDIKVVGKAPLFDPVAIKVGNIVLTLRNNEADFIFIEIGEENDEN